MCHRVSFTPDNQEPFLCLVNEADAVFIQFYSLKTEVQLFGQNR